MSSPEQLTYPDKTMEEMHVGHGSTHVREPRPIDHQDFGKLFELPDELKGLQVNKNRLNPTKTAFTMFEKLGPQWAHEGYTARAMVIEIQEYTGEMLNATDVKNMLGWANQLVAQANGDPLPVPAPTPRPFPSELRIPIGTPEVVTSYDASGNRVNSIRRYEDRVAIEMAWYESRQQHTSIPMSRVAMHAVNDELVLTRND